MLKVLYKYVITLCFFIIVNDIFSQESIDYISDQDSLILYHDIFDEVTPAEITLRYDIKDFQKKKRQIKEMEGALKTLLGEHVAGVIKKSRLTREYLYKK